MYANVLLPQKVGQNKETLTYRLPEGLNAEAGQIVEIPLRNRKVKGVILEFDDKEPPYKTRDIIKITENAPHLSARQLELMRWIADYNFSPLFRALKLFLPVPFIKKKKLIAETPAELAAYEFNPRNKLSDDQLAVLEKFNRTQKTVSLLHGITGSGKTEIYLHIADKNLQKGRQVLMLIPEISLTPQTLKHFENHFKQKIAVIHSRLTAKEKQREWMAIYKGEARIVIGSRSALFAPFRDLGCIILDEEHDSSYKQDQSPRYHAFDVAVKMAEMLDIKLIAGSATPTIESYYKAETGKFELLEMASRAQSHLGSRLPKTRIVDLREEIKKKNFSIFSEPLQEKIREKLAAKEQMILFLNRRGAASAVICRECGLVVKCDNCDMPLTYHTHYTVENSVYHAERLICHHCGRLEKVPRSCPKCRSIYIRYIGLGTQRVEDELGKMFPQARILRADRDTTSNKGGFKKIYDDFISHNADILVGTQMIAFGLHIPKVNLVGIVLADMGLTIPNFRSGEKTFQLITQVAGRAGRERILGDVVIQTYLPDHYAIRYAAAHDYKGFYNAELALRKELDYPPFSKLIKLTVADANNKTCLEKIQNLARELEANNNGETHRITYYPALIPKFKNRYRWHILISGPDPARLLKKAPNLEGTIIDTNPGSTV
jgi:primosomal protein N' (replication factor Y) (superfamily II helicase)